MCSYDPYHSRDVAREELVERVDPVVWGEVPGPLTRDEVDAFRGDGFLVREGVFSPDEVARLAKAGRALTDRDGAIDDGVVREASDDDVVRSVFRVHRGEGALVAALHDERVAGAARQLLGGDVYFHQSRLNFKPPFAGQAFPWHSDFETWHVEDGMPRPRALSASLLLTDNYACNGPLMIIRGSHRWFLRCVGRTPERHFAESLVEQRYGTPSDHALTSLVHRGEGIATLIAPAGSVVLFDSNAMHGSAGNMTPYPRHNLFAVFNSVENRLGAPFGGTEPRPAFLAER